MSIRARTISTVNLLRIIVILNIAAVLFVFGYSLFTSVHRDRIPDGIVTELPQGSMLTGRENVGPVDVVVVPYEMGEALDYEFEDVDSFVHIDKIDRTSSGNLILRYTYENRLDVPVFVGQLYAVLAFEDNGDVVDLFPYMRVGTYWSDDFQQVIQPGETATIESRGKVTSDGDISILFHAHKNVSFLFRSPEEGDDA